MKTLFKTLLATAVFALATSAFAKETITIVYSWTAADGPANYSRTIADEANKLQNKYTFIFDTKPGAGGSVAANHVLRTPNTILATASAFFVRPNFFPNESYNLDDFQEIFLQCNAPMAITSFKYKTWKDVPTDKPLTIGVSGLGTTTHLGATQVAARYPNVTVIPFKSTSESLLSMASGNTDLHVAFLGEVDAWTGDNKQKLKLEVLGLTGTKRVAGYPTLAAEGFGSTVAQMQVPFHLVVPANMPAEKFKEIRDILIKAGKKDSVRASYKPDQCEPPETLSADNLQPWYNNQRSLWKRLSTGVKIN